MIPDLSEASCIAKLEPYLPAFRKAVLAGVRRFNALPVDDWRILMGSKRAQANAIHQFMCHEAKAILGDCPEVIQRDEYEATTFEVPGQVEVRLKKLSSNGMSSNLQTTRSLAYNNVAVGAEQYELLPDSFAVPVRVDLGYVLDATRVTVEAVLVSLRIGPSLHWVHAIPEGPAVVELVTARASATGRARGGLRIVGKETQDGQRHATDDATKKGAG